MVHAHYCITWDHMSSQQVWSSWMKSLNSFMSNMMMSGDDVTVGMATETDKQILDRVVEDFEKNFKENFKM